MLAGQGSADASQLAIRVPAGAAAPSTQATASAVASAQAAIGATPAALAGRVYATGDKLVAAIVDQHGLGWNNFRNDWMPDGEGFTGGNASVEFVHLTYPGE